MTPTELIHHITSLIPCGEVSTYGDLAKLSGIRSPRFVGNALHRNTNWRKVPCHRIVNAAGRLAPAFGMGGARIHEARLKRERIHFVRLGTTTRPAIIDVTRHRWNPTKVQIAIIRRWRMQIS